MTIAEKLTTIAENEQKVYDAGKKAEYDRFWDAYQQNGNRTDCQRCFSGVAWTAETLKPKYDIKPKWGGATAMFQMCGFVGSLKEHFESLGIGLDLSEISGCSQLFYQATGITELPVLDFSNTIQECTYLFYQCTALETLGLVMAESTAFNANCFTSCTALKNLTVEGTIGNNLDIHWSTNLTVASVESIINALGGTASRTLTLPSAMSSNPEYTSVIATKPSNWTVSYL